MNMERKVFFSTLSASAGILFLAPALVSCSKSMNDSTSNGNNTGGNGSNVDFILDLTLPAYSALNNNGGSVIKDNIIVAKTVSGMYVALSSVCTHQGGTVGYDSSANRFHCPNHGSNYATDGTVINGPAAVALKRYNTQLTGNSLRVFA